MAAAPLLVILTGPSGAGKDTLAAALGSRPASTIGFAVTATTRPPRDGEADGRDYHFVSEAEFERMIREGEMLEHAIVYGQHKGVPTSSVRRVLDQGKDVLLRTDVQGARFIKTQVPGALTIFVAPPSREEMERRLRERDSETEAEMTLRLRTASEEMDAAPEFDHTVVNDDLERAAAEIETIIATEHDRPGREPLSF
ncbi:MAG TPA: guanylate kinase [Dehalococcoidia bacterium]